MNYSTAGVQPIRGLFGGQPGQQSRQNQENRTPLGASRLQNGSKAPGNTSGWAFGPSNGIPGLPTPQTRPVVGASSFAQTIGSGQQQQQQQQGAPLDPSEFPSLSGAPQASFQNIGQAWAQQRAAQSTPVQSAPSAQPPSLSSQQQIHQAQDQVQQTLEDTMFGAGNMGSGADTFRNGHQADGQPQPGSHDEFPPLGQMGSGDISQDRRINMMQNAASGGFPSIAGFAPSERFSSRNGRTDLADWRSTDSTTRNRLVTAWTGQRCIHAHHQILGEPPINRFVKGHAKSTIIQRDERDARSDRAVATSGRRRRQCQRLETQRRALLAHRRRIGEQKRGLEQQRDGQVGPGRADRADTQSGARGGVHGHRARPYRPGTRPELNRVRGTPQHAATDE